MHYTGIHYNQTPNQLVWQIETYDLWVRQSAEWVYLPQQHTKAPHIGFCGKQLFTEKEKEKASQARCNHIINEGFAFRNERGVHTLSLRASGEVHLMGSLAVSWVEHASLVIPKSLTLAMLSSDTRTLRAARSRCTKLLASRYSMAAHTSLEREEEEGETTKKSTNITLRLRFPLLFLKGPTSLSGIWSMNMEDILTVRTLGGNVRWAQSDLWSAGSPRGCPVEHKHNRSGPRPGLCLLVIAN